MAKKAKKPNMKQDKMTIHDLTLIRKFQKGEVEAGAEFIENHYDEIVNTSRFHANKIKYDFSLGADLYNDCISEGTVATYKALQTYDFKGSSIMTYVNAKIRFQFLTIKRNSTEYRERYDIGHEEQIGLTLDDNSEEELDYELKDAVEKTLENLDPSSVEWAILRLVYNAMVRGIKNPITYVAKHYGYTKPGISKVISRVKKKLPSKLGQEICSLLRAA